MTLAGQVLHNGRENHHLPGAALMKLRGFEDQWEEHCALARATGEKLTDEIKLRDGLNLELRTLEDAHSRGGLVRRYREAGGQHQNYRIDNSGSQIQETKAAIDLQNNKIAALNSRREENRKRGASRFANLPILHAWVDRHCGDKLTAFAGPSLEHGRKTGEEWDRCVGRHRLRLAQLRAELHRVASAPIPAALAKRRAREEIDQLVETGTPNVEACIEGGKIRWPRSDLTTEWGELVARNIPATMPLFFWLFRDQIIERIEGEIDSLVDPSQALSDAQRTKLRAGLLVEMLEVERVEEAAITAASAEGVEISRRVDADPRAVLGLAANVPGLDADQLTKIEEATDA